MRVLNLTSLKYSAPVFCCLFALFVFAACAKSSNEVPGVRTGKPVAAASSSVLETKAARSSFFECDTCIVSGMYEGTSYPNVGSPSNLIYSFHENNLAVGYHEVYEPGVSFGGYRHNCDSIIWTVNYTLSGSYYMMKGAFSSGTNTISGTFQNLNTPSDYGTFTMTK